MDWKRVVRRWTNAEYRGADAVIAVGSLLVGGNGVVCLPMLPATGDGAKGIEFAAASVLERVVLGALVRREQPQTIFEIGTFRGVTARTFAENAPVGATLWTLDLPRELTPADVDDGYYRNSSNSGFRHLATARAERNVGVALRNYVGPCAIHEVYGDAAQYNFEAHAPIDFFFVDGCHEYEASLRDTRSAWKSIRSGGLLVWHDANWTPVWQAIRDANLGVPISRVRSTSLAFARKP